MKWVESSGGPLVLVPEEELSQWSGIHARGFGASDYERPTWV